MRGAVDAHHHLWNPSDPGQGWLADAALATIRRRFDLQDLHDAVRAGVAGRPVTATVLVQSVARTDESERLLATAAADAKRSADGPSARCRTAASDRAPSSATT